MNETKTQKVRGKTSLFYFQHVLSDRFTRLFFGLIPFLISYHSVFSQQYPVNPRWLNGFWSARWIAHPSVSGLQFGVFHFRKEITLEAKPQQFVIHVSADNRYRLFVNGVSIGSGPARSDLANWNFETYDIAPYLHSGSNIITATVWNFAEYRAYAQFSFQTAFILQGDAEQEKMLNTDASWKVFHDKAYSPLPVDRTAVKAYMVVAQGEQLDARNHPWNFASAAFDDRSWPSAQPLWYPAKTKRFGTDGNWQLVPRYIPLEEETTQFFSHVVTKGYEKYSAGLSSDGKINLTVPPGNKITLLIDQSFLTNAYPHLSLSNGRDASVTLTYAEALFDKKGNKGHRDSTEGKKLVGLSDRIIADGGREREFSPLHYRTFRYVKVDIETKDAPLTIHRIWSVFTAYPFHEKGNFSSDQPLLQKVWDVGWRTARLCAMDTYMDCPYYEQLQYVGDTRIQSLISLYVSGDERLMKKAIDDIAHSFIPEGLTQSRYPCYDLQVIPTFSLWWIQMLHDLWMHRKDDAFIKSHIKGIRSVLTWYHDKLGDDRLLGPLDWWQFTDWSWPRMDSIQVGGVPPGVSKGGSVIISLQYAYTLKKAAALLRYFDEQEQGNAYEKEAQGIAEAAYRLCWDEQKQCMADTREKLSFSQHANILAVLADAVPPQMQGALIDRIIADTTLTKATYYFTFYLFEAMEKSGRGNRYLDMLGPWQKMLERGLTTFAEQDDPTRSDCHAWSASPNYELLSLVCGIRPLAPGFEKIIIRPHPGTLNYLEGKMPHPAGSVTLRMQKEGSGYKTNVSLPHGVTGVLVWRGKETALTGGEQQVSLE